MPPANRELFEVSIHEDTRDERPLNDWLEVTRRTGGSGCYGQRLWREVVARNAARNGRKDGNEDCENVVESSLPTRRSFFIQFLQL